MAGELKEKVGVLALQGGFAAHVSALRALGAVVREVRTPDDLACVTRLVLPGGESSTQLKLLHSTGLYMAIKDFAAAGYPLFGTCAGAILMARDVRDPEQDSLNILDIEVSRNAWGRQVNSFEADSDGTLGDRGRSHLVFIRAPRICRIGSSVEVLLHYHDEAVLVRKGVHWASTFHPELTSDPVALKVWLQKTKS